MDLVDRWVGLDRKILTIILGKQRRFGLRYGERVELDLFGVQQRAQQIASDQAAIDAAQATLIEAQQQLNDAQLTSPINGTIASVGVSVGDTVTAGSSTSVFVIIGTQSYQVTGTLTSTQVQSVKVGYPAQVAVDGTTGTLAGTVAQVGPVQSSSSGYTYPVVVALPTSARGLYAGSTANASIRTSEVKDVLALPTSAVLTRGTRSYVLVLSSGSPVEKTIKVGIIGDIYTQVRSGLHLGSSVVLADYSEPVPSSNTATVGGFGGAGGFGGGGRFSGGGSFGSGLVAWRWRQGRVMAAVTSRPAPTKVEIPSTEPTGAA